MARPRPYVREAGAGPGVVCLHANASTSAQWRPLMDLLSCSWHVLAPDCYGSGKSTDWPSRHSIRLDDEVDFIEPVLARAGFPVALVGHSYGAAIAANAALRDPARVRALALYEPTLFSLIDAQAPPPNAADGIKRAVSAAIAALDAGRPQDAARHFIDYWMGEGSWASTPPEKRAPIAESVSNIRRWAHALLTESVSLEAFRALDLPVLYMVGERSTAAAHGVARLLAPALPRAWLVTFPVLGHMGPLTHPAIVNAEVARFLERTRSLGANSMV